MAMRKWTFYNPEKKFTTCIYHTMHAHTHTHIHTYNYAYHSLKMYMQLRDQFLYNTTINIIS